jgi:aminoglycoside 6'-N-acetyltransferase I
MIRIVSKPTRNAAFLVFLPNRQCVAFAEAAIRHDYVNGCKSTPVGFLEGIFVEPTQRRKGIARALCAAVEDWSVLQGCSEFASDADLRNTMSHLMHGALSFTKTERVVFFRKSLSLNS